MGKFVFVLGLFWLGWIVLSKQAPGGGSAPTLITQDDRRQADNREYQVIGGQMWRSQDHRGKVLVVNLWATWCGPCVGEIPDLVSLAEGYKGKDVEFLGVSTDTISDTTILEFAKDHHMPYPIARYLPEPGVASSFGIPVTFIFDKQGRLAAKTDGPIDLGAYRKTIDRLLGE